MFEFIRKIKISPRFYRFRRSIMFLRLILQLSVFWFAIHLINYILLHIPGTERPYRRLLRSFGCHISLCNIGFYTTYFNRLLYRIGTRNSRFWKIWFTLGIFVALITAFGACLILIFLPLKYLYDLQQQSSSSSMALNATIARDQLLIQPIIPGVNVPLEQLIHFFLALLVCTVFHELGHAVAASAEQVRMNGCGYFLFVLYPGAYVDLNHEQVEIISAYKQLRIYCAGVFHNMILVLFAVIFLLIHPFLLRHFYIETASVSRVSENSPVYNLLPVHSKIQSIDGCLVYTSNDWYQCLRSIHDRQPLESSGYCLTQSETQSLSSHIEYNQTSCHDCCQNLSQKNYCFLYYPKQSSVLNGACLEVRSVIKHPSCRLQSDCQYQGSDSFCVHPFSADNITRLIRIAHNQGPVILFVGSINELSRSITIQSYQAKYNLIPIFLITDVLLFFQYVAAFSFALAFFNAVPCYALDGQYILSSFIEYCLPRFRRQQRFGLVFGTSLLIGNISLAFARYFL